MGAVPGRLGASGEGWKGSSWSKMPLRKLGVEPAAAMPLMGDGEADGGVWRKTTGGSCSTESSRRWSPKPVDTIDGLGGDSGGDWG